MPNDFDDFVDFSHFAPQKQTAMALKMPWDRTHTNGMECTEKKEGNVNNKRSEQKIMGETAGWLPAR